MSKLRFPRTYVGPSFRQLNLAHNTTYKGAYPAAVQELIAKLPALAKLIVPTDKLVEARRGLENSTSAIYYARNQLIEQVKGLNSKEA